MIGDLDMMLESHRKERRSGHDARELSMDLGREQLERRGVCPSMVSKKSQ